MHRRCYEECKRWSSTAACFRKFTIFEQTFLQVQKLNIYLPPLSLIESSLPLL